jgi:hypothetical protein
MADDDGAYLEGPRWKPKEVDPKSSTKNPGANESWHSHGSYGSEQSALSNAERISRKYLMVRVLNPDDDVI